MNTTHSTNPLENLRPQPRRRWPYVAAALGAVTVTIALLYVEENWRGKRAWENCKRQLEAKGLVLDWSKLIPPPVPDDQNIFMAPKMSEFIRRTPRGPWESDLGKRLSVVGLTTAPPVLVAQIQLVRGGDELPEKGVTIIHCGHPGAPDQASAVLEANLGPNSASVRGWETFVSSPLHEIKPAHILLDARSNSMGTNLLKSVQQTLKLPAQFRLQASGSDGFTVMLDKPASPAYFLKSTADWEADFNFVRQALKRPFARIDGDYSRPFDISTPNFVAVRTFAQALADRALCFLLTEQPGKALEQLTLLHQMSRLLQGTPDGKPMTLVAAMINVAIKGLYVGVVKEGLRLGAWNEPQLAALEEQLKEVNLLPWVRGAFVNELPAVCQTAEHASTSDWHKLFEVGPTVRLGNHKLGIFDLAPRGWIYQNMTVYATLMAETVLEPLNSGGQFLSPRKIDAGLKQLEAGLFTASPFRVLARAGIPNLAKAAQTTARNQTLVNQARTVCALESYRIAHGQYPETLDSLVRQFIDRIPLDIIGGQPAHYRKTESKFVLYSIGWSEMDHGGKIGDDWVWPMD